MCDSYRIDKLGKDFVVLDEDLELVEESRKPEGLAVKISENPEIMEAYRSGHIEFYDEISEEQKEEILGKLEEIIANESSLILEELSKDN